MKNSVGIIIKLNKEKFDLISKIRNLEDFKGSKEWEELSCNHKYLLDIQLQSMKTYIECLNGRINDILCEEINENK